MNIQELSVFGEYKQPENRVTAGFLQILKIGGEPFIRNYLNRVGISLPSNDIKIETQVKGKESIPDGTLSSNFSFNLYVESKVKRNSINILQLERHKEILSHPNDYLLYITPDKEKPDILENINWSNWNYTQEIFNNFLQSNHEEANQILEYLIQNFSILLDNMNLLGDKWDLNNQNVIILAGSWAESIALKYNYYICQNKRTFKSAK